MPNPPNKLTTKLSAKLSTKMGRYGWLILPLVLSMVLGVLTSLWVSRPQPTASISSALGGDFELQARRGPVGLQDFRGQGVVLFFGYTSCPDVCPSGLTNVAAALDQLEPALQAQIQPIFISVDPQRDTPERLAQYSRYFHPRLLGVTGTQAEIDQVVKRYGAFYRKVDLADSALEYAIDHTTRLYLIDPRGQLVKTRFHNDAVSTLTEDLRLLVNNN